jgi:hypothetical protein
MPPQIIISVMIILLWGLTSGTMQCPLCRYSEGHCVTKLSCWSVRLIGKKSKLVLLRMLLQFNSFTVKYFNCALILSGNLMIVERRVIGSFLNQFDRTASQVCIYFVICVLIILNESLLSLFQPRKYKTFRSAKGMCLVEWQFRFIWYSLGCLPVQLFPQAILKLVSRTEVGICCKAVACVCFIECHCWRRA